MMKSFPAAALLQHIAIVGKTGAGKSSTAKLAIEQVVAEGSRVCVLDPIKSDWWGVISSADGKRPGLPFHVLGGPRAHVPLHSGAGTAIADLVARGDLPLSVLDMAEFEPGGQLKFFVDFAPRLLQRMRGVLYLVLEEAHLFAPKERSGMGHENMAIHWAKALATAGRSKGIRLIVATQRTQALHNAVLGSCDTLIAHRLTAPADQGPVNKWLEANVEKGLAKQVAAELSSLKTGTAWLCAGEAQVFERIQFPRISTFDNSAAPTADAKELQVRGYDVDLDALRTLIGASVAEAEANDPKLLKKKIGELEKQLREQKPAAAAKPPEGWLSPEAAIALAEDHAQKASAATLEAFRSDARPHIEGLAAVILNGWKPPTVEVTRPPAARASPASPARGGRVERKPVRSSPPRTPTGPDVTLPAGERLILTAIAQHGQASREQVSILTGYKRSTRDAYIQRLSTRGFVQAAGGGSVEATQEGVDALGSDFEPLPTGQELQDYWLAKLPEGERACLAVLLKAHPAAVDRETIGDRTSYKRSTRDAYLQRLGTRKLVVSEGRGMVRASDELF